MLSLNEKERKVLAIIFLVIVTIIVAVSLFFTGRDTMYKMRERNRQRRRVNTFEEFTNTLQFINSSKSVKQKINFETQTQTQNQNQDVEVDFSEVFIVNPFEDPDALKQMKSTNGNHSFLDTNYNQDEIQKGIDFDSDEQNNKGKMNIATAKKMSNVILYCNLLLKQGKMMYSIGYISKFLELLVKASEYLSVIDPENTNENLNSSKKAILRLMQGIKQFSKVPENKENEASIYDLEVIYQTLDEIVLRLTTSIYEIDTYSTKINTTKLNSLDKKYKNYKDLVNITNSEQTIRNDRLEKPANKTMFVSPEKDANASNAFNIDPNSIDYVDVSNYQAEVQRRSGVFEPRPPIPPPEISFPNGSNGNIIVDNTNTTNTRNVGNTTTMNNNKNNTNNTINTNKEKPRRVIIV